MAKDEGVTIKLGVKPKDDHTIDTYNDETTRKIITITVTRTTEPRGSDFLNYTHTLNPNGESQPFTVKAVIDDQSKNVTRASGDQVTSVSSYYWGHYHDDIPGKTHKKLLLLKNCLRT